MNIFLAGASGVIGRRLVPLLRDAGHLVTGTTRSPEKAAALDTLGAKGVVVDVYDARALLKAMYGAHPDVVIHQLTDLPDTIDPQTYPAAIARNSRVRTEGTHNLMSAAHVAGARRVIAQSVAFAYAPGTEPYGENATLDRAAAEETRRALVEGILALESSILNAPGIDGIVLRYGYFYGPGTWNLNPARRPPIHIDAAAHAALLAVTRGAPGIYNVAEQDGLVAIDKACQEFGFDPAYRIK
jgi:nucleoside-diphosphate-sugar epimerase